MGDPLDDLLVGVSPPAPARDPLDELLGDTAVPPTPAASPAPAAPPSNTPPAPVNEAERQRQILDAWTKEFYRKRAARQARIDELSRRMSDPREQSEVGMFMGLEPIPREFELQELQDLLAEQEQGGMVDVSRIDPKFIAEFEAQERVAQQQRATHGAAMAERHPVLSFPGVAGAVSSLAGTAASVRRVLGTEAADASDSALGQAAAMQEAGVERTLGTSTGARIAGGIANALGGFAADVLPMLAPGGALAKAGRTLSGVTKWASALGGRSAQVVAANTPYAARAFEQTLHETGDPSQAAFDAIIEGVIPVAFPGGVEAAQLGQLRAALGGKRDAVLQVLRSMPDEAMEEGTQELAGAVNEYLHGKTDALDPGPLMERIAIAMATGGLASGAMTAGSVMSQRASYDQAIQEAAARQAALAQPAVGPTAQELIYGDMVAQALAEEQAAPTPPPAVEPGALFTEAAGQPVAPTSQPGGPVPPGTTFTTERGGSVYVVGEGGITQRNKGPSGGLHAGDVGMKEPSQRTVYVHPDVAGLLGRIYAVNTPEAWSRMSMDGDQLVYEEGGTDPNRKKARITLPYYTEPAVGLHPVEFMARSQHLGSMITAVSPPGVPVSPAVPTTPDPFVPTAPAAPAPAAPAPAAPAPAAPAPAAPRWLPSRNIIPATVGVAAAPAPAAPVRTAATIDAEILALDRAIRGAKTPEEKAALMSQRVALAQEKAQRPSVETAGATGLKLVAAQTQQAEAAAKGDQAEVARLRSEIDALVAGEKTPLKKPAKPQPAQPVAPLTDYPVELEALERLLADPNLDPAKRKNAQARFDDLLRTYLSTPPTAAPAAPAGTKAAPPEPSPAPAPSLAEAFDAMRHRATGKIRPGEWTEFSEDQRYDLLDLMQKRGLPERQQDALFRRVLTAHRQRDVAAMNQIANEIRATGSEAAGMGRGLTQQQAERMARFDRPETRLAPPEPSPLETPEDIERQEAAKRQDAYEKQLAEKPAPPRPPGEVRGLVERETLELPIGPRPPEAEIPRQPAPKPVGREDISQRSSEPVREATPEERAAVGLENEKAAFQFAFTLNVGTPFAQIGVAPKERTKHREAVRLAPLTSLQRNLKPMPATDIVTGEEKLVAPAAFYIGRFEGGRAAGKYAVFQVNPRIREKAPIKTAANHGTTLVLPNTVKEEVQRDIANNLATLRGVRAKAARQAAEEGVTPDEKLDLIRAAEMSAEDLQYIVNTAPSIQNYNAPYYMVMSAETARLVDDATKAGDEGKVMRLLRPMLHDSYDAAHTAAVEATGKPWRALLDADAAAPEGAAASVAESAGEEGEDRPYQMAERPVQEIVTEEEKSEAEKTAAEASRAGERRAAGAAINRRDPGAVRQNIDDFAKAQARRERAAWRYLTNLRTDDAVSAWIAAATKGDAEAAKAAEAACRALLKEAKLRHTEPEEFVPPSAREIRAQAEASSADPFLRKVYGASPAALDALRTAEPIPGISALPMPAQYFLRSAQRLFPGTHFTVKHASPEKEGRGGWHTAHPDGSSTIGLVFDLDAYNALDERKPKEEEARRQMIRRFAGTVGHELFHRAFDHGTSEAVFGAISQVLGPEATARMVAGARKGWFQRKDTATGKVERIPYYDNLWKTTHDAAIAAGKPEKDAAAAADTLIAEELVAFAFTKHIENNLFTESEQGGEGAMAMVQAVFSSPEMGRTADLRVLASTIGVRAADPEKRSVLAHLERHFIAIDEWIRKIARTPEEVEAEKELDEAREHLGTVEDTYTYGTEKETSGRADPGLRPYYLGEVWHANIRGLAEIVTAANRALSGRVMIEDVTIHPDGSRTRRMRPIDTWVPTTELGREALRRLQAAPPVVTKLFGRAQRTKDSPPEWMLGEEEEAPTGEQIRREMVEKAKLERSVDRFLGVKTEAKPLRERAREWLKSAAKVPRYFGTQYRELGLARTPPKALAAQLLDTFYSRINKGRAKAEAVIHDIGAPLIELEKTGATKEQITEAFDLFGDWLHLRNMRHQIETATARGEFVPGTSRILTNKIGGTWKFGTDLGLFYAMFRDAQTKMVANPAAKAMAARYDAVFEAMRAEAAHVGVADELSEMYYHHQVLMFNTPDAKERRKQILEAAGQDPAALARSSGSVLKAREANSLAEINLNPWEAIEEAVVVFDRILARAELSKGVAQHISVHNLIASRIQTANREEALRVLDVDPTDPDVEHRGEEFVARKENQLRLIDFFGSLLRSETELADRPWLDTHAETLEAIRAAYDPKASATKRNEMRKAIDPIALRNLAVAALEDSPPMFQDMVERAVLGSAYAEPYDFAAAYVREDTKRLFPEGYLPAAAPFKPAQSDPFAAWAGGGHTYHEILRRAAASAGAAAVSPQLVLPEEVAAEIGHERVKREQAMNKRTYGLWATARKVSVIAQLSSPLTVPRYLFNNLIGNTGAILAHDPAALGYIAAASRLLYKNYYSPQKLTTKERLILRMLQQEGLLSTGLGGEFRDSNNALTRALRDLTTMKTAEERSASWWRKTWQNWDRMISPHRKFVDDYARVAMFLREIDLDPYLSREFGSDLDSRLPRNAWVAWTNWARGETGMAHTRLTAAEALQAAERTGDTKADAETNRRIAQVAAARIRGSLGNYDALSRFGESFLGRGVVNVFYGFPDNVMRTTLGMTRNWLAHPTMAGKVKATARGAVILAVAPLLVRVLNGLLHGLRDDDDYEEFLKSSRTNPWTDLYLGDWAGKPRVIGLSAVATDTFKALGIDTAADDVRAAIAYAGTDDYHPAMKILSKVLGKQLALIADPQIAWLDVVPTALGVRWNAQAMEFQPPYDTTRQLLTPWGVGGLYDWASPASGQHVGGVGADLLARPFDPHGDLIARAKARISDFNETRGIQSGAKGTMTDEARLRNSLRQALLWKDHETARRIVDQLYDDENRDVGPDNLLKSFGASSVYHRLGSESGSSRAEMREKLHRWLSPDDREVVQRAETLQQETFNPWRNPELRRLLWQTADTEDRKFRTARALAGALTSEVAEVRTETKRPTKVAITQVAEEYGIPRATVQAAYDLQKIGRELRQAAGKPNEAALRTRYLERARRGGITE